MISRDDIAGTVDARLIAFTGPAGCGKSTAAQVLMGKGWQRVKFASILKDMCRAMGMTEEMIEGYDKEKPQAVFGGQTPRFIMQTLGTEWGRKTISPDLWVSITKAEIQRQLDVGHNVVVDDCRFDNEADCIRFLGGVVVSIDGRGGISGAHESESGVTSDYVIDNNGTLEDLEDEVERLVAKF